MIPITAVLIFYFGGRVNLVGKKKRDDDSPLGDTADRDLRDIRRCIRRIGLVESRQSMEGWYAQVSSILPEKSMREFDQHQKNLRDNYELLYRDFDHSRLLHVSWRSQALEVEIAWMLPRLRKALARVEAEQRFLVELGAGHGAAAAVISKILKVPVIAVDPEPTALGLPEQFASKTGGEVTSVTGCATNLNEILTGAIPAAIFGMGVFRYFQEHVHDKNSFSYMKSMDRMLARRTPEASSLDFFESNKPAELIFSESGCPDYLAEVLLGAHIAGYGLAEEGADIEMGAVAGGQMMEVMLFHLVASQELMSTRHPFIELYEPLPVLNAGLVVEGVSAEAIRSANSATIKTIETIENRYDDGTLRREVFTNGNDLARLYDTSTTGYRAIRISPISELQKLREQIHL
jgi:hypothetical protein